MLDDDLRSSALRLLEVSEVRLRAQVVARSAETGFRFADTWSEMMRLHGGVLSGPDMLPCATMLATLQGRMHPLATDNSVPVKPVALTRALKSAERRSRSGSRAASLTVLASLVVLMLTSACMAIWAFQSVKALSVEFRCRELVGR